MIHRLSARAALACSFALVAAACNREAPPAAINTITIHATDYAFQAPDTVPAGLTRIVLIGGGPSLHHAQLIRLSDGRTFDSLMAAFRTMGPTDPPPAWMHMAGGPNPGAIGDTTSVTQMLEAGHYVLLCFVPDTAGVPHMAHGMVRPMEVVAAAGAAAAEPTADVTVTLADYSFTESATIAAGRRTIRIVNSGPQSHEVFIARLDSNTTTGQVVEWVSGMMKGPPPAIRAEGGVAGMEPGSHVFLSVNLTPGRYGLFCFVPGPDGREHTHHGMVKEIRVS